MGICASVIFGLTVCSGIMQVSGICPMNLSVVDLIKVFQYFPFTLIMSVPLFELSL